MMKRRLTPLHTLLLLLFLSAELAAANWEVHIDSVHGQSFDFSTGSEHGAELRVEVYDECRKDSSSRNWMGEFYPSSSVMGMKADHSRVHGPGGGNHIAFSFSEGINENGNLYTDNGDNTAKVEFCAQVGLYHSGVLINFSEVSLTYTVDLISSFASLTGYTVTGAEAFTDAEDVQKNLDGGLLAFFCDGNTFGELQNDGHVTHQGSIIHLCFKVASFSDFQIKDVQDLMVRNGMGEEPIQIILSGSNPATPAYAEKTCHEGHGSDTNVCVVSFMLKADFYDYHQLTLTGEGQILLELGGASGRRLLRQRLLAADERLGHVTVKAMEMRFNALTEEEEIEEEKGNVSIPIATAAVAGMVTLCGMVCVRMFCGRRPPSRKDQVYQKLRMKRGKELDCSASCVSNETIDLTMSNKSLMSTISDTPTTTCVSKVRDAKVGGTASSSSTSSRTSAVSTTSSSPKNHDSLTSGQLSPTKLQRTSSSSRPALSKGRPSPTRGQSARRLSPVRSHSSRKLSPTRLERGSSSSSSPRKSGAHKLSPTKLERTMSSSSSSQRTSSSHSPRSTNLLLAEDDLGDELVDVAARNSGLSSGDIMEMTSSMQSAFGSVPEAGRRRGSGSSQGSNTSC